MKRPVVVPRQESLMYPIVKNPFVHNLQLSTLDIVRVSWIVVRCLIILGFFSLISHLVSD